MLAEERAQAVAMARKAGAILLEVYGSDFDVDFKGESNPVTKADRLANAYLVEALAAAFPSDGIVAEENASHGDATSQQRCWYVDPLDGTKEFIAKNGEFSVMLGLAIDGRAQLGVVYQPELDKLYHGVVGEGSMLEHDGEQHALRVSDEAAPSALRLVVSRSHRSETIDQVVSRLGLSSERPSGSVGLKIGHIAEQNADLYVHVSDRSCKWDACGPEAILRAAGGRFTDLAGRPFEYRGDDMQNRGGILACNAAAFDAVLPAVRDVGRTAGYV